jgi:hypothetical protein
MDPRQDEPAEAGRRVKPTAQDLEEAIWRAAFQREGEVLSEKHLMDRDEWFASPREMAVEILAVLGCGCDFGSGHSGQCFYESGTDDD